MQLMLMMQHGNNSQDKYVIAAKHENNLRSKISLQSLEIKTALLQKKMDKEETFFGDIIDPLAPRAKVTFMVMSARSHFSLRDAIRNSWALEKKNFFFVVGGLACKIPPAYRSKFKMENHHCEPGPEPVPENVYRSYQMDIKQEQINLEAEAAEHSDLFLAPMMDTYGGLPRKVKEALRYCLTVNHGSDWCMKVDDDMIVRTEQIERALSAYDHHKNMIVGRIRRGVGVPKGGKWADHEYTKPQYPPFCNGDGWIVPHHLAQLIVDHDGFEYQGEDVSMGIWLDELTTEFNLWQKMQQKEMLVKVYQSFPKNVTNGLISPSDNILKRRSITLSRLIKEFNKAKKEEETYWQQKNLNPKLFHNRPNDRSGNYSHLNHEMFAMYIKLAHSSYTKYHYASSLMEEKNEKIWNINKKKRMYQHFQNIQNGIMFGLEPTPAVLQANQFKKNLFGTFLEKQGSILTNSTSLFLNKMVVATFLENNILQLGTAALSTTSSSLSKNMFQDLDDHYVSSSANEKDVAEVTRLVHENLKLQYENDQLKTSFKNYKIEMTHKLKGIVLNKFQQDIRNNLEQWMSLFLNSQLKATPWHVTWTETRVFAQFQGDRYADCTNKKFLIIGHNLSPGLIKRCGKICVPGKYAMNNGWGHETTCTECDVGKYAEEDNSQLCTQCEAGKANPFKGSSNSSDCATCKKDTYSSETGAGVCSSCGAGKYSDSRTIFTVDLCKNCPRGYYAAQEGRQSCSKCETGMYSTETTAATVACENCMVGRYSYIEKIEDDPNTNTKMVCKSCSVGMYCHILAFFDVDGT